MSPSLAALHAAAWAFEVLLSCRDVCCSKQCVSAQLATFAMLSASAANTELGKMIKTSLCPERPDMTDFCACFCQDVQHVSCC